MRHVSAQVILRSEASPQAELPLATDGIARWVWEGKFGSILIEVRDGDVFVNGDPVHVVKRPGTLGEAPDTNQP